MGHGFMHIAPTHIPHTGYYNALALDIIALLFQYHTTQYFNYIQIQMHGK